jgi:hypothetical protein
VKRHGQAASSGSKTKAPGSAGGYLLDELLKSMDTIPSEQRHGPAWEAKPIPGACGTFR